MISGTAPLPTIRRGVQLGLIFMPTDFMNLGLTYTTPQETAHDNINLPNLERLKLEVTPSAWSMECPTRSPSP